MMIKHRRTGFKCLALAVCIGGAFFAASKPESRTAGEVSQTTPRTPSPMTLLDLILIGEDGSASGLTVNKAVEKARAGLLKHESWVNLGDTLRQRLRETNDPDYYQRAELAYQQALRLEPASADAMNGMAWLTGGRHQFGASIDWANKALAIAPDSADAFGILGDAELELGNYDTASAHYQKMVDLRPDLSSWSRGAWLLWITGDKTRGVELMEKAIRAGGPFAENTAWCRARLATMRLHEGNHSAAAEALAPSLRELSKNPHILLAAARLATATREHDIAKKYYQMLLEKGPNHDALAGLGDLCAVQGKMEEAETYYVKVEELHAAHQEEGDHGHLEFARFLADHDRDLLTALRLAVRHKLTRNVLEADTLAWVYLKNGQIDRAREAITIALSQNTPDAAIHYHAGMIAAAAGDPQAAHRHLGKALAMNPRFDPLQVPIAERMLANLAKQQPPTEGLAANPVEQEGTP